MSQRTSILVVDDIPLMRTILAKYLKSVGMKVLIEELGLGGVEISEAANGKSGLALLRSKDIDLVFLDLMMPEMDGLAFLAAKRQDPKISSIPVIVCSALGESQSLDRARALGASGFVIKPFTLKSVEKEFRHVIGSLMREEHSH